MIGLGAMGVQLVAVAARAGADVLAVEPRAERRELAARFGAAVAVAPAGWRDAAAERWDGAGPDVVIVAVARAALAAEAIAACAPGGRVVLFAGFGDDGVAAVDLNRIHYQEITLVGSEWIGTPPHQRYEHYEAARDLLASGELPLEQLVSDRTGLDGRRGGAARGARAAQPQDGAAAVSLADRLLAPDGRLLVVAVDHPLYSWPCRRAGGSRRAAASR